MKLLDLLTPPTQARLATWNGMPPDTTDPGTFGVAAEAIVGDGPDVDKWRLVVLLVAMEGRLGPQDAADICVAMGDTPTAAAAATALESFAPEAKVSVMAGFARLDVYPDGVY